MSETAEAGTTLAWRLLATLEGGSLLLVTSALLAYTARNRNKPKRNRRTIRRVLVTNTRNSLGRELKKRFESRGCVVISREEFIESNNREDSSEVDALVVVGAEPKAEGLEGISELVSEDVYENLKLLEHLCPLVRRNGCVAWACAGAVTSSDAFSAATHAFDSMLRANLTTYAHKCQCEPVWVERCREAKETVEKVIAAIFNDVASQHPARLSIRNVVHKITKYLFRWLKIIS